MADRDGAGARIRYLRLLLSLEWREEISQNRFTQIIAELARAKGVRESLAPNSGSRWESATAAPPDDITELIEELTGASRAWIRYGDMAGIGAPRLYAETGGGEGRRTPEALALLARADRRLQEQKQKKKAPPRDEAAQVSSGRRVRPRQSRPPEEEARPSRRRPA